MGARQSSDSADSGGEARVVKISYYEVLGIERQADEIEIKKAYRRKALELHPDRNFGKEEDATRQFAEVQTAYEVLSDAQERAWYDSHESAILQGVDPEDNFEHNVRMTTADDISVILGKFHGKIDYSDASSGFFGFLHDTFAQIAKEEGLAAQWDGLEDKDYPSFGHKDDDYEDVVRPFYAAWMSFSTQKSFAWKDRFKLSEAPDRRYRRAMEKENQKLRNDGIREFNDAVRLLVAAVRKRDPRFAENAKTDEQRQKALRDAAKEQAARARAENAARIAAQDVPEWAKSRGFSEDEQSDSMEEDEAVEEFECVACNKTFKSDRQFEAHEKSKKHQKAIQSLRRKMEKDDAKMGFAIERERAANDETDAVDFELIDDDPGLDDSVDQLAAHIDEIDVESTDSVMSMTEGSENPIETRTDPGLEATAPTLETARHDDAAVQDSSDRASSGDENHAQQPVATQASPTDPADSDEDQADAGKKVGKAAQKRAKKAAKQMAADQEENKHQCAQCGAAFPSRTRLFQHISDFGHAALKNAPSKGKKGKGKR